MSEATILALSPWGGVALLLTWQILHERACAKRWNTFIEKFGTLKGRVDQWHQDHGGNRSE